MSLRWSLFQAPFAVGDVGQESEVAEDLELLADFVFNVAIVGMEFFEFWREGVDFFVGEFWFVEAVDEVKDVESPPAIFNGEVFERFYFAELGSDFFRR
jgi:hypothetical protein